MNMNAKCQMPNAKSTRLKCGFSLIELLIVVAIISILVSLGAVSYSQAQKKARDSRRSSDMKAIQNAMEQYYADTSSTYPTVTTDLTAAYLPAGFPSDPLGGTWPAYNTTFPSSGYCSCAKLEGTTTGGNSGLACAYGSGSYYCVSNLQ